ncbi:hypothetical protein RJ640_022540 [Escallonia rubra]|uniref:Protein kinase domain-containing protein n=1 Tax=Escallonia rubra TaxID=112253 RepID=A0AA88UKS0_9ASTE|nr:hypothetical protein RJ640_022540 [Escallonia rubra]
MIEFYYFKRKSVPFGRNVKGANILVDANGEIKVADYGMEKHIRSCSSVLSFKGSPYWMAPEGILTKQVRIMSAQVDEQAIKALLKRRRHRSIAHGAVRCRPKAVERLQLDGTTTTNGGARQRRQEADLRSCSNGLLKRIHGGRGSSMADAVAALSQWVSRDWWGVGVNSDEWRVWRRRQVGQSGGGISPLGSQGVRRVCSAFGHGAVIGCDRGQRWWRMAVAELLPGATATSCHSSGRSTPLGGYGAQLSLIAICSKSAVGVASCGVDWFCRRWSRSRASNCDGAVMDSE